MDRRFNNHQPCTNDMGAPVIDFEIGNAEIAAKALLLGSEAPENIAYPHLRTAFSGQEKNTMPKVSGLFTVLLGSSWLVAIVILISSGLFGEYLESLRSSGGDYEVFKTASLYIFEILNPILAIVMIYRGVKSLQYPYSTKKLE